MDSKHRHELQENELAAWLEQKIDELRPYGTLIVIGLVGLVLIYTAWGYYSNASTASDAADWNLYTSAMLENSPDLDSLETASEELERGAVANWADITLADGRLFQASQTWMTNRTTATDKLKQARDEYDRLLLAKGVEGLIQERAQLGLARSYELEGDAEKAIAAYKLVSGAFADIAKERAETLSQEDVQQDLAWLQTAQAQAFLPPTGPGVPGQMPDFSPDSLEDPSDAVEDSATSDESLDDILKGYEENPEAGAEMSEEPAVEAPAETTDPETSVETEESQE